MTDQIRGIVESLPSLSGVTEIWGLAEERLHAGDAAFLGDLGVEVAAHGAERAEVWQYESVFNRLLRLLSLTQGPENLRQALRLISAAGAGERRLEHRAASLLATGHAPEDLVNALFGIGTPGGAGGELRACVVQELVLRDFAAAEVPAIVRWADSARQQRHPLSWLPLELSEFELARDLPSYTVQGGSSHSMPYGPSGGTEARVAAKRAPRGVDVTTEADVALIGAAVENWVEESNGAVEARVFRFSAPIGTEVVPAALLGNGLDCLREEKPRRVLAASACTAREAWRILFAAAASGGAYNSGSYGAYGRLFAWRSLAGLVGAAHDALAAEVAERARVYAWYRFDADSPWFHQVAWDIGLAALDPSRVRVAVLAATDTD